MKVIGLAILLTLFTVAYSQDCNSDRFKDLQKIPTSAMTDAQYDEYARLEKACNRDTSRIAEVINAQIKWKSGFFQDRYFLGDVEIEKSFAEQSVCRNPAAKNALNASTVLAITSRVLLVAGTVLFIVNNVQNIQNQPMTSNRDNSLMFIGIGIDAGSLIIALTSVAFYSSAFSLYNKSIE